MKPNTIYNGDCFELVKNIPGDSVDLILEDMPYSMTQNNWDTEINLVKYWQTRLAMLKPTGVIALTASQPFTSMLVMSNLNMFKHEWIWQKNKGSNFANTVREPFKEHESILIFSNGRWTYNKQMQNRSGSGLDRVKYKFNHQTKSTNYREMPNKVHKQGKLRVPSSIQRFNTETGFHPTQKPVSLFEYLIRTYTNEGDLVFDGFAGSGTTAMACIKSNRNWICIEKEKKYCDIAEKRIKQELSQIELML